MSNLVTPPELAAFLGTLKGAQPISVSALTKADIKLPDGREVWKLVKAYSFARTRFADAVNRARQSEGLEPTFTPKPRSWGVRKGDFLVAHKDAYYLPLRILRTGKPAYFTRDEKGFLRYLKSELVTPYLPPDKSGDGQGVDKPIVCRDYRLDSLVSVSVAGKRLRVVK